MTTYMWKFRSKLGSGVAALVCAMLLSAVAYAGPRGGGGHGGGGGGFHGGGGGFHGGGGGFHGGGAASAVAAAFMAAAFTLAASVAVAGISAARAHSPRDRISPRM